MFWKLFPEAFGPEALPADAQGQAALQQAVDACAVEDLPATPRNTEMEQKIGGRLMTCKTSEFTSVVSISVSHMLYRKPGNIYAMRFDFTP